MTIAVNQNHITQCKRIVHVHAILLSSALRHSLYAIWCAAESGEVADSLTWLREALTALLRYLATIDVDHWRADAATHLVASTDAAPIHG